MWKKIMLGFLKICIVILNFKYFIMIIVIVMNLLFNLIIRKFFSKLLC